MNESKAQKVVAHKHIKSVLNQVSDRESVNILLLAILAPSASVSTEGISNGVRGGGEGTA